MCTEVRNVRRIRHTDMEPFSFRHNGRYGKIIRVYWQMEQTCRKNWPWWAILRSGLDSMLSIQLAHCIHVYFAYICTNVDNIYKYTFHILIHTYVYIHIYTHRIARAHTQAVLQFLSLPRGLLPPLNARELASCRKHPGAGTRIVRFVCLSQLEERCQLSVFL